MASRRTTRGISVLLWLGLASLFLAPAAPAADRYKKQCSVINKQLIRYDGVAKMARERGDASWHDATREQIKRLETREKKLCPEQFAAGRARRARREMAQLMRVAGQAALRYFTFGAL